MTAQDKQNLLDKLDETHLATRETFENVEMEKPVFADSGWRVRDLVGHIATWDREIAKSLSTYQNGSEYLIPDLDEEEVDYNQRAIVEQRKLSAQQIVEEWERAYNELRNALQEMPEDRFPGDMVYPWGDERGTIAKLIEYMIEHVVEHREEIIAAE